ncbi:hypothetical protein ZWY2020_025369 [Hordeum vulgare]|nr:hypothetical protein ZWY2020_025369 [Hordeum vulgare]
MEDVPNQHDGEGAVQTNVMDGINAGGLQSRRRPRKNQEEEGSNLLHAPYGEVLYVDSLVIDIQVPDCPVWAEAWDNKRIVKVAKSDRKPEGGYGKLTLKQRFTNNKADGLFVGYEQTEKFVSSKLPPTFQKGKKRKILAMLSKLCSEFSENIGTFIEYIGKLDTDEVGISKNNLSKAKQQRVVGDQGTTLEEADNDGGTLEDDEEYLPSSESGEDEEVASTYDSFDAFVAPIPEVPKKNKLTQSKLVSRSRAYATTKEGSSSGAELAKESADHSKYENHAKTTCKVNPREHMSSNENRVQMYTTDNIHG